MSNVKFVDVLFEQECAAVHRQLIALESIWRISDLELIGSENPAAFEEIMERLALNEKQFDFHAPENPSEEEEEQGDEELSASEALFEILGQGVVLCSLLNVVKPNAIKKINKQTNRDFMCKENVWRFLAACKSELGMGFEQLFSVSDCYSDDVVKQRKVLKTVNIFLKKFEELISPEVKQEKKAEEKPKEVIRQEQKKNVIKELVETERNYVRDLAVIRDDIMRLEKAGALSKEQIYSIFANVRDILKFQSTFLIQLEDCPETEIGELFLKWSKDFSVYGPYCLNHESSGAAITSHFTTLVKANLKLEPKFELGSFLLKPVQRICKYPLLLRELSKNTEENTTEHAKIVEGLEAMKGVTSFINDLKKRREASSMVKQLESKIENWDEKGDMRVYGVLKHDSMLTHLKQSGKQSELHCFAFERMFMYCKEEFDRKEVVFKFRGKVLLSDTGTTFEVLSEKVPGGHCFRLTSSSGEALVFRAKNKEQLNRWVAALKGSVSTKAD